MAHQHSHSEQSHTHIDRRTDKNVVGSIVIDLFLALIQIVGGLFSGSLALIAIALHSLLDAIALAIALYFDRKGALSPPDSRMSFGYGRAEIIADAINYTTLVVLSVYLMYEGATRFFAPELINGWIVFWIAGFVLVTELILWLIPILLLYRLGMTATWNAFVDDLAEEGININTRAVVLHMVAIKLGRVVVIVAGTAVILFNWTWVDSAVAIMISVYILWYGKSKFVGAVRVLMLGAPTGLDPEEVACAIEGTSGVASVHHIRLWSVHAFEAALTAHLVVRQEAWDRADDIRVEVKQLLKQQFGLGNVTLEIEGSENACAGSSRFGHKP